MQTTPETFLNVIAPDRDGLVVAVECLFTWYWLADLCTHEGIPVVLGQALYMKAIHGGKAKNDKIDAHKIAGRPAWRHAAPGLCRTPPRCGPLEISSGAADL